MIIKSPYNSYRVLLDDNVYNTYTVSPHLPAPAVAQCLTSRDGMTSEKASSQNITKFCLLILRHFWKKIFRYRKNYFFKSYFAKFKFTRFVSFPPNKIEPSRLIWIVAADKPMQICAGSTLYIDKSDRCTSVLPVSVIFELPSPRLLALLPQHYFRSVCPTTSRV